MNKKPFDPLEYIESAFLDTKSEKAHSKEAGIDVELPDIKKYLGGEEAHTNGAMKTRFRKTQLSAPRPRKAARAVRKNKSISSGVQEAWESLPKNMEFLLKFFDDGVTSNYYTGDFKETREELIMRLLNPQLTLEEVSRLLGVCPATVRRYTNKGWLDCHRTEGGQRRFKLTDVVKFVERHGRFPEE